MTTNVLALNAPLSPGRDLDGYLHMIGGFPVLSVEQVAVKVAAMLISICLVVIETPLTNLLGSYSQTLEMAGFDPIFLSTLLAIGGLLGVAGALVAASQRLKGLEIL